MPMRTIILLATLILSGLVQATQTQTDSYTQYELLDPKTNSFRILYYVSATNEGAKYYFNTLRKGSDHEVSSVIDRMTGQPLQWLIVNGETAKKNGLDNAQVDTEYLQVTLARSIPKAGQARILIDKTYKDANSYYVHNGEIVFERLLGVKRNSVVLPKGYELIASNYPSQVQLTQQSRIKASFMNNNQQAVNYKIVGRKLEKTIRLPEKASNSPWPDSPLKPLGRDKGHARYDYQFNERAFQNRDIVYFLQQPESNAFRLYHDYTETRVGVDRYLNIVRKGSKASDPEAYILDTGEKLAIDTLKGKQITAKNIDLGFEPNDDSEVIVIWFDAVKKGQSVRLRITETYTDPNRYLLHNDELIWDRSFGRNRNTLVLPDGWLLTTNSIPAIIDLTTDNKVRLRYVNDRPDNIDVFIKGLRR